MRRSTLTNNLATMEFDPKKKERVKALTLSEATKAVRGAAVLQMLAAMLGWIGFAASLGATKSLQSTYLQKCYNPDEDGVVRSPTALTYRGNFLDGSGSADKGAYCWPANEDTLADGNAFWLKADGVDHRNAALGIEDSTPMIWDNGLKKYRQLYKDGQEYLNGELSEGDQGQTRDGDESYLVGRRWTWPDTVSEMGGALVSPAGRLFFAFELLAGMLFFLAQAPAMLERAGSKQPGWLIRMRTIVPPLGLLIVATVAHVATRDETHKNYTRGDYKFQTGVHLVGAGLLFVGTSILECLALFCFESGLGRKEFWARLAATALAVISCGLFLIGQIWFHGKFSFQTEVAAGSFLNLCLFTTGLCAYLAPKHRGPLRLVELQFDLEGHYELETRACCKPGHHVKDDGKDTHGAIPEV